MRNKIRILHVVGVGCLPMNINPYGTFATGNRVQILVEIFCVCFLQIYVGVVHIPLPLLRSNCRGRQGLFFYVGYDNICDHCADWGPHCTTKHLLVMHPLISVVAFSLYQFQ